VLDIACGVGYGAYLMATQVPGVSVYAVDIAPEAISYAAAHYAHRDVQYAVGDALRCDLPGAPYDAVVSFETLEHIEEDRRFLRRLHRVLRRGGRFVVSTPDEDVVPFEKDINPYHVRHYRKERFEALLAECGFHVLVRLSQRDRDPGRIRAGFGGLFNIAVCGKSLG